MNTIIFRIGFLILAGLGGFGHFVQSASGEPAIKKVVCLGDSVTHGFPYADTGFPGLTYPSRLEVLLETEFGPESWTIDNQGVNGYKAEDVVADLSAPGALSTDPDYVLLMVGGNDLAGATFETIGALIEETRWEVQSCIDLSSAHLNGDGTHPEVIVSAFIPNRLEAGLGSLAIWYYNQSLEENLSGYRLWFAKNWDDFYDPAAGEADSSLMFDPVHPNSAGYELMAENWFSVLETLAAPSPTPVSTPPAAFRSRDFSGDGSADIGIFRPATGLWAVRSLTRVYYGCAVDRPVGDDYDGDGSAEIAVFREENGLWAIRDMTRLYFGGFGDRSVPGDYDRDGTAEIAIFRGASGLWAVRGMTRIYFGAANDYPLPDFYASTGPADIAVSRPENGLWAIRSQTRFYFGEPGDFAFSLYSNPSSGAEIGIFRPGTGLWAVRGTTRLYYGAFADRPVPADYSGSRVSDIAVFREDTGLWAIWGISRCYFGESDDTPLFGPTNLTP